MTEEIAVVDTAELDRLAQQINEAHKEAEASVGHSLRHAIHAGELLNKARAQCPHGTWEAWHTKYIRHSLNASDNYRNLALNKDLILANSQKFGHLGYVAVLRLLKGGQPMLQSMSNEWWTPKQYIDAVREVLGEIDLDPATTVEANVNWDFRMALEAGRPARHLRS